MDIRLIETFDDSGVIAELDRIQKVLAELEKQGGEMGKSVSDALKKAEGSSDKFGESVTKTTKAVMTEAKAVDELNTALEKNKAVDTAPSREVLLARKKAYEERQKATKAIIAEKDALVENKYQTAIAAHATDEAAKATANLAASSATATGATEKLTIGQRILNLVLKANPIGLIISAVSTLIALFLRGEPVIDKFSQGFAALNAVADVLTTRLTLVGSAINKLFSGNLSGANTDLGAAFDNLGGAITNAATQAIGLEKAFQDLQQTELNAAIGIRLAEDRRDKLVQFAEDETKSIEARKKALQQALTIEQGLSAKRISFAKQERDIIIAQNANLISRANTEENNAAKIKVLDEQKDAQQKILDIQQRINALDKESAETLAKEREALAKIQETIERLRVATKDSGLDRDIAAINKKYLDLVQAAQAGIDKLREVESRRGLSPQEQSQLDELGQLQLALDKQRLEAILMAGINFAVEAEDQRIKLIKDARERAINEAKQAVEAEERVELTRLDAQEKALLLEAQNDEDRLAIQQEFEQRRLELTRSSTEAIAQAQSNALLPFNKAELEKQKDLAISEVDFFEAQGQAYINTLKERKAGAEEIALAEARFDGAVKVKRLEAEIAFNEGLLKITDKGDAAQITAIKAKILSLKETIKGIDFNPDEKKKKPVSILSLLGIDPESDAGKGITTAANEAINAVNSILNAQLQAASARTEMRQKEYDEAKSFLEKQQAEATAGNAADVQSAKDALAQRRTALEASFKEEQRIRKAQLALDSVTQLSGLITSSVNIFKALSPLGPFGVAAAIGTIALMFGSFAVAKSKALQAINQDKPKLRKGKFVEGPTHEGGGVPHTSVDGRTYEVEGKEAIIGTEQSKEHEMFLRAMISGKFKGVNLNALVKEVGGQAPSPLSDAAPRAAAQQRRYERAKQQHQYQAMVTAYRQETTRVVDAINEKPVVYPWKDGYKKAVTKGKHTEIEVRQPGK